LETELAQPLATEVGSQKSSIRQRVSFNDPRVPSETFPVVPQDKFGLPKNAQKSALYFFQGQEDKLTTESKS